MTRTEANRAWTKAVTSASQRIREIRDFRKYVGAVLPVVGQHATVDMFENTEGMDADVAFRLFFADLSGDWAARTMMRTADAGAIVLTHAMVEDVAYRCIRLHWSLAPSQWGDELPKDHKVPLSVFKAQSYARYVRQATERYLAGIEQGLNLVQKAALLWRLCRPSPEWRRPVWVRVYDPEAVRGFTDLRNRVAHESSIEHLDSVDVDAELERAFAMPFAFLSLLAHRFPGVGLAEDPRERGLKGPT